MPYTQVFDEKTEKWVLRKVDALPSPPVRRRVQNNHEGMQGYGTLCINCGIRFGQHSYGNDGYIRCGPHEDSGWFEW